MPSLLKVRRGAPWWNAPKLGRSLARIACDIHAGVRAIDGALRAEFDKLETDLADILRAQPNVRLPEHSYCCKDPHIRIRHDHGLLCTETPRLASELDRLAYGLCQPTAPELSIPAFVLGPIRPRAPKKIDVNAAYAAIVREARARGLVPFEGGSAEMRSVAYALTGSTCPVGKALLLLSKIEETPGRTSVSELANVVYFAGSWLATIADLVAGPDASCGIMDPRFQSIVESLRDLGESLQGLDARIRETCLFDPTPRRRHSRDIAYQEVACALANAGFDDAEIARLIVPTSERRSGLWERRVGEHVRAADLRSFGMPPVDSWGASFKLSLQSRLKGLRRLN